MFLLLLRDQLNKVIEAVLQFWDFCHFVQKTHNFILDLHGQFLFGHLFLHELKDVLAYV